MTWTAVLLAFLSVILASRTTELRRTSSVRSASLSSRSLIHSRVFLPALLGIVKPYEMSVPLAALP